MTVKELRKKLKGIDGNMTVLIPVTSEFDGRFYTPCLVESEVLAMGTDADITDEDLKEAELLNKELPTEDSFVFVPCGFFDEKDHSHELN